MRAPHRIATTPSRPLRLFIGVFVGVLSFATPAAPAEFVLFHSIWGNAIVNTDMTPEGRMVAAPTPGQPAYYRGLLLGAKLGSIPGDDEPTKKSVDDFVVKLLAKHGYLAAQPGVREPSLFLVVQWGYLAPGTDSMSNRLWFLGYDPNRDPGPLLAAFRSREVETIIDFAGIGIYGIIVTAFDYRTARSPKPVALWQTRIALPATGKSMTQALPPMFVAGADAFGRETKKPALLDADVLRANGGHVRLGDLQFLEAVPAGPAAKR